MNLREVKVSMVMLMYLFALYRFTHRQMLDRYTYTFTHI